MAPLALGASTNSNSLALFWGFEKKRCECLQENTMELKLVKQVSIRESCTLAIILVMCGKQCIHESIPWKELMRSLVSLTNMSQLLALSRHIVCSYIHLSQMSPILTEIQLTRFSKPKRFKQAAVTFARYLPSCAWVKLKLSVSHRNVWTDNQKITIWTLKSLARSSLCHTRWPQFLNMMLL